MFLSKNYSFIWIFFNISFNYSKGLININIELNKITEQSIWKKKKWRHQLLYDDVIHFFLTRKCQKTRKIEVLILNEKISISSEQLEELQWNFQERRDLILQVTKKQGFTLSLEYTNLEQVTTTEKIWSERNLSKISNFLILGSG